MLKIVKHIDRKGIPPDLGQGKCSIKNSTVEMCINSFCHLRLEIALAIPASNEREIETNKSEVAGFTLTVRG